MQVFVFPAIVSVIACVGAYVWGGFAALFLVVLLAVLETTLSFDNAVVNAKVLARMDEKWQRLFLVWGIPVAVFGTRFVLPIFIVAAAAGLSPLVVTKLALFDPAHYGEYIEKAHVAIAAFGAAFLFMVSLKYFFNDRKTVHWIAIVEKYVSSWGGIEAIEVALTLSVLLLCSFIVPAAAATILFAGTVGVVLFIIIEGVAQSFEMAIRIPQRTRCRLLPGWCRRCVRRDLEPARHHRGSWHRSRFCACLHRVPRAGADARESHLSRTRRALGDTRARACHARDHLRACTGSDYRPHRSCVHHPRIHLLAQRDEKNGSAAIRA